MMIVIVSIIQGGSHLREPRVKSYILHSRYGYVWSRIFIGYWADHLKRVLGVRDCIKGDGGNNN